MKIMQLVKNMAFNIKIANKKKHDANFKNLITDLKSAHKNTKKKVYFKTRIFKKNNNIGKLHCAP